MKKIIYSILFFLIMLSSCTKDAGETLECETLGISYVDINNADNEPYYMYINDVYIMELGADYYIDDYEIPAGYHEFRFVEVNAIIPNVDVFSADFSICEHSSIVFGENDPLK